MVTWTAPTYTGGLSISHYTVTSSGGQTCTTANGTTTTCTVTGLTNGTAYTFTVTATNSLGTGPASAASAPATPSTVPGAPTGVTATGGQNAQSTVSWTAPSSNGGSAITGYTVTSTPGSILCTTTGATSCTVTGLTNGTSYTFKVTATNGSGTERGVVGVGRHRPGHRARSADRCHGHLQCQRPGDRLLDGALDQRRQRHHRVHGHLERRSDLQHHRGHHLHGHRPDQRDQLHLHGHGHQRHRYRAGLGGIGPGHTGDGSAAPRPASRPSAARTPPHP